MDKRPLKVGVQKGGGEPPGYQWHVWILDAAHQEATSFLNDGQYKHIVFQLRELALQDDPSQSDVVSVDKIEDFFELREKGGPLGGMNVRIYYGISKEDRAIVILGARRKQNNGQTPQGDKTTMRRRWRRYGRGEFGKPVT